MRRHTSDGASLGSDPFWMSVMTPEGDQRSCGLDDVATLAVDWFQPVRLPAMYKGQRHMPGLYWSATDEALLWYESRLELAVLRMLDFDPEVVRMAVQPFRLHGPGIGRPGHVPDVLVALASGGRRVIDVSENGGDQRARERLFDATRRAVSGIGWGYVVEGRPPTVLGTNVQWLAGYRRRTAAIETWRDTIIEACTAPVAISELERRVGCDPRIRPALFHLLWIGELVADLSLPLSGSTVVTRAGG